MRETGGGARAARSDELIARLLEWREAESPGMVERLLVRNPELAGRPRRLLRALTSVRVPEPVPAEILALEDELLRGESSLRPVVDAATLPGLRIDPRLAIWRGDITALRADAIVNAGNPQLLGCFAPLHRCIDNAIHSAAGMRLRLECAEIMAERGRPEPAGTATVTSGHHLPARRVMHTVGPLVQGAPSARDHEQLAACYLACLEAASADGLSSIAFCCISTGEYAFPKPAAAERAVETVRAALDRFPAIERVVFNVFTEHDELLYRDLLGPDA